MLQIRDKLVLKNFENYTQNQRNHVYFDFQKMACCLFPQPLIKGIFSVFGRFIEDFFKNLRCWVKSKNRFGLSAPKLSKNP
jgi:hypothetical protein